MLDLSVAGAAERLAHEFANLGWDTVVGVLSACVDEYPRAGTHFIEQAARARLRLLASPQRTGSRTPAPDPLDVSLHDVELATEVELTARLMIAANQTDRPLSREAVDAILDVTG